MPILMLAVFIVGNGTYAYFLKRVQQDHVRLVSQSIFFVALNSLFQLVFLLILPPWQPLAFSPVTWSLATGYVVLYAVGAVLMMKALSLGAMSLTHVVMIIRNFIPILVGLFIWDEKITWNAALGIIVFIGAIWFINGARNTDSLRKVSPRWLFFSIAAGVVTGAAMCFSKEHGIEQPNAPREYLIAFNILMVMIATPYIVAKRREIGPRSLCSPSFLGKTALVAFAQAGTNVIFMIYINRYSSASFFPMIAILGVLATTAVGRIFFRDRIGRLGYAGVALSLVSIVLLNL
jgi:drug/metabolite transporter (DMT)-like permease